MAQEIRRLRRILEENSLGDNFAGLNDLDFSLAAIDGGDRRRLLMEARDTYPGMSLSSCLKLLEFEDFEPLQSFATRSGYLHVYGRQRDAVVAVVDVDDWLVKNISLQLRRFGPAYMGQRADAVILGRSGSEDGCDIVAVATSGLRTRLQVIEEAPGTPAPMWWRAQSVEGTPVSLSTGTTGQHGMTARLPGLRSEADGVGQGRTDDALGTGYRFDTVVERQRSRVDELPQSWRSILDVDGARSVEEARWFAGLSHGRMLGTAPH